MLLVLHFSALKERGAFHDHSRVTQEYSSRTSIGYNCVLCFKTLGPYELQFKYLYLLTHFLVVWPLRVVPWAYL